MLTAIGGRARQPPRATCEHAQLRAWVVPMTRAASTALRAVEIDVVRRMAAVERGCKRRSKREALVGCTQHLDVIFAKISEIFNGKIHNQLKRIYIRSLGKGAKSDAKGATALV